MCVDCSQVDGIDSYFLVVGVHTIARRDRDQPGHCVWNRLVRSLEIERTVIMASSDIGNGVLVLLKFTNGLWVVSLLLAAAKLAEVVDLHWHWVAAPVLFMYLALGCLAHLGMGVMVKDES